MAVAIGLTEDSVFTPALTAVAIGRTLTEHEVVVQPPRLPDADTSSVPAHWGAPTPARVCT